MKTAQLNITKTATGRWKLIISSQKGTEEVLYLSDSELLKEVHTRIDDQWEHVSLDL